MGARGVPGRLLKATDANGITGFGFEIEHGGLPQFSIAWPDKPATRMTYDMADRMGVSIEPALPERPNVVPPNPESSGQTPNSQTPNSPDDAPLPQGPPQGEFLVKNYHSISATNRRLLDGAGLKTRQDVINFCLLHGSLSGPIKGIGPKGEAEILQVLNIEITSAKTTAGPN